MSRTLPLAGFALTAAAATIALAPAALAESAAPSPRPSVPTLEASAVPSQDVAVPRPSATDGRDTGDIEVPAGKADVSVPGHSNDLLAVTLAGGGALLLAGGAVVVVSRRRA